MASQIVELVVNGEYREVLIRPGTTLLRVLRDEFGLTAAKRGCEEGSCGACTAIVDGKAVRSCLIPAETVSRSDVLTLEGIVPAGDDLSPLQQAMLDNFATQCGFCNSGMLMSATALLAENPDPTRDDVTRAISGIVCRCTGYHAIIDAILDAAGRMRTAKTAAE